MEARAASLKQPQTQDSVATKGLPSPKAQNGARAAVGKGATSGARTDKWRFRIGAFAIIERDGLILLARRSDIGWWNLPGGGLESGETVEVCRLAEGQEDAIGTSDEVSETGWFAPDELPADLLPKHRQRVQDAVSGQLVPILRAQRSSTEEDQDWTNRAVTLEP